MAPVKAGGQKEMSSILAMTNSALIYEPKCWGGGGGVAVSQLMSTAVHMEPKQTLEI